MTMNFTREADVLMPTFVSCLELGLRAGKKGDFQFARQMLHSACEELLGCDDQHPRLIELMADIADTYLAEENYDLAERWYQKALHRSELLRGANALQTVCLMVKLAEVNVLQEEFAEFQKYMDGIQRAYFLTLEESVSILLFPLTDLSWALCIKGRIAEVKVVNSLIAQIRQLDEEDKSDKVAS
jgi:tetratricopeptide (TPR) repeat protein